MPNITSKLVMFGWVTRWRVCLSEIRCCWYDLELNTVLLSPFENLHTANLSVGWQAEYFSCFSRRLSEFAFPLLADWNTRTRLPRNLLYNTIFTYWDSEIASEVSKRFKRIKFDCRSLPKRIYNTITAMGFSAMLTIQLDTPRGKHCRHPISVVGVVDTFRHCGLEVAC